MLGNKIYELRKEKKLSQEQLAEKLGVTRQTVSNWETDQTIPDFYQAKQLSECLEISLDELAGKEATTKPSEKIILDKDKLWDNVLKDIQKEISNLSYDTWFTDVNIISIDSEILKLSVCLSLQQKHLKENYSRLIIDTVNKYVKNKIKNVYFILKMEESEIWEEVTKKFDSQNKEYSLLNCTTFEKIDKEYLVVSYPHLETAKELKDKYGEELLKIYHNISGNHNIKEIKFIVTEYYII